VIPWKSLRSQRIEAHIEKIFLVVGPRDESTFSDEADENREQARKQAALAHADLIKQSKNAVMKDSDSEGEGRSGSSWFWEKWIAPVIDNVQVSIGSVHIRYEDDETVPGTCFSAGVTLESLNVRSTDSNWVPMFVSEVTRAAHKLIHLQNLSIYLNTRDKILVDETKPPLSGSELAQLMDSLVRLPHSSFSPTHNICVFAKKKKRITSSVDRLPERVIQQIISFYSTHFRWKSKSD
jgi:vacuolar protein sorting-associated protein 13A/C